MLGFAPISATPLSALPDVAAAVVAQVSGSASVPGRRAPRLYRRQPWGDETAKPSAEDAVEQFLARIERNEDEIQALSAEAATKARIRMEEEFMLLSM
jgi:hypothetical protein